MSGEKEEQGCAGYWSTLSPERLQQVEQLCKDDSFSESTMLHESQSLRQVCEADEATLKSLGITRQQIVNRVKAVVGKYHTISLLTKLGKLPPNSLPEGRFIVKHRSYKGAQSCPFQHPDDHRYFGYEYGSEEYDITDAKTGSTMLWSTLMPHLINEHGFFEGTCAYRVDPMKVSVVFGGLEAGNDCKAEMYELKMWKNPSPEYDCFGAKEKKRYKTTLLPGHPAFSYYMRCVEKKKKVNSKGDAESDSEDSDSGNDRENLDVDGVPIEKQELVLVYDKTRAAEEKQPIDIEILGGTLWFYQHLQIDWPFERVVFRLSTGKVVKDPVSPV